MTRASALSIFTPDPVGLGLAGRGQFTGLFRSNPSPCVYQIKNPRHARDFYLVPREGFEPPTCGIEAHRSNPLSYRGEYHC